MCVCVSGRRGVGGVDERIECEEKHLHWDVNVSMNYFSHLMQVYRKCTSENMNINKLALLESFTLDGILFNYI